MFIFNDNHPKSVLMSASVVPKERSKIFLMKITRFLKPVNFVSWNMANGFKYIFLNL